MTCKNCKRYIYKDDAKYCPYCGSKLISKELKKPKELNRKTAIKTLIIVVVVIFVYYLIIALCNGTAPSFDTQYNNTGFYNAESIFEREENNNDLDESLLSNEKEEEIYNFLEELKDYGSLYERNLEVATRAITETIGDVNWCDWDYENEEPTCKPFYVSEDNELIYYNLYAGGGLFKYALTKEEPYSLYCKNGNDYQLKWRDGKKVQ